MAKVKRDPIFVAIDDGYAQVKLFGESPVGGEPPVRFITRSSIRPGRYGLSSLSGQRRIGSYRTSGEDFTASEDIDAESTQFDGFHTSSLNRVLVHHALAMAGYRGQHIDLMVGLPLGDFFFNGNRDDTKISAKRANLMIAVENGTGDQPLAELASVKIGCQAIAAFVDYYLDDNLKERNVPIERVAVVDIGGRTTDIAVVIEGERFDDSRSGTANLGVLDTYNLLSKAVQTRFETRDKYPLAMMDKAVRSGKIVLWGEEHDISDLVSAAVSEQEAQIAREVERRLGSASNVDVVLFVGGGASLFKAIGARFRNGRVGEDPEFANARGLYKSARYHGD